jgi:hypothetical protein
VEDSVAAGRELEVLRSLVREPDAGPHGRKADDTRAAVALLEAALLAGHGTTLKVSIGTVVKAPVERLCTTASLQRLPQRKARIRTSCACPWAFWETARIGLT